MNQYEFYSNFFKYRKKDSELNEMQHAGWRSTLSDIKDRMINHKYYNKIELPSGKMRYFYSKEEWDAYQKEQDDLRKEKEREVLKRNYTSNRRYAQNAGADRAAKEKENAEKKAKEESVYLRRKELLEKNQAGREAAIKKAEPTAEEAQRRIDWAKARDKNAAEQEAKKNNPVKKFANSVAKAIDQKMQEKNPVYKAAKKLQSDAKKTKDYVAEHKYELERDLSSAKKAKLDELNNNSHEFERYLRRATNDKDYDPTKSLQRTPLYQAIEQYLREENEDFVSIEDNFRNSGSLSTQDIKNAYKKLTRRIEDEIDNMTIEQLAKERMKEV